MNRSEALDAVRTSLRQVVPDADVGALRLDDRYREVLELDSLDFLRFIEVLGDAAGIRIDDEDTPQLCTLSDTADFLVVHTG